ncbi:MAG: hypothetical protein Ct9H300mP28_27150 [Pseudomonadota bacterium]|nr:MAG: hypothetical protein Ct9H300mP28_27150 [Pseudomonadota bacterium]
MFPGRKKTLQNELEKNIAELEVKLSQPKHFSQNLNKELSAQSAKNF